MKFLSDTSLPGLSNITGAYFDSENTKLVIGCAFRLLTEPRSRAVYGGHSPYYRLALYERGTNQPTAHLDRLKFPVNDVAFHPELPILAIATGSYDGGFYFEGELLLWNWLSNDTGLVVDGIPEVHRVAFDPEGNQILTYVRPWSEYELNEDQPAVKDPFNAFYEIRATFNSNLDPGIANASKVTEQMLAQNPVSGDQVDQDSRFSAQLENIDAAVARHCGTESFRSRSPIWDVAWLDDEHIGIVHDDCLVEILSTSGDVVRRITGKGYGCEIFGGKNTLVHTVDRDNLFWLDSTKTKLLRIGKTDLDEVQNFQGSYTFSRASDGRLLARSDRIPGPKDKSVVDFHFDQYDWHAINLGRYDVFNHYIRIDDSPYLFFVQDDDPSYDPFRDFDSRSKKWLCLIEANNKVRRLWRILEDDGTHASTASECSFAYVKDDGPPAIIVAGEHYDPDTSKPYFGFIYRRDMESGKEDWRQSTTASASTIGYIPSANVVVAFFLNGDQMVIDASTGQVLRQARFAPNSIPSVVYSCDIKDQTLVIGTMDGRVAIANIDEIAV